MIIKQTSKYKNNKPFCSGDVEPEHKFLITAPTSQHTGYFRLHRLRLHNNAYLTFYNLTLVVMVWLETVNRLLRNVKFLCDISTIIVLSQYITYILLQHFEFFLWMSKESFLRYSMSYIRQMPIYTGDST